jgi:hypothetical protein
MRLKQYWEAWFADGRIITSETCEPQDLPRGRIPLVLQPGAYERTGWKDRLLNINHLFFRTDLDCWTEHEEACVWALEEMKDHAHVISCYRQGKWQGDFKVMRAKAEARYQELINGRS